MCFGVDPPLSSLVATAAAAPGENFYEKKKIRETIDRSLLRRRRRQRAEGAKGRKGDRRRRRRGVIPSFSTFSSEKNAGEEAATRQTHCEREEREGVYGFVFSCLYPVKRERDNRMAWHHPTRLNQEGEHSLYFTSSAIPWREREREREREPQIRKVACLTQAAKIPSTMQSYDKLQL